MKGKKALLISVTAIALVLVSYFGAYHYKLNKLKTDSKKVFSIVYKDFSNNIAPTDEEKEIINNFNDKYLVDTKFSFKNRKIIIDTMEASGHLLSYYDPTINNTKEYLSDCKEHALELSAKYTK